MSQSQRARSAEEAAIHEHRRINDVPAKAVVAHGFDGTGLQAVSTDSTGRLNVNAGSSSIVVDANNTTTTALTASGGGATFTGTATDISAYSQINVEIYGRPSTIQGDGSNAKASLFLEFSPDGTNWDISIPTLIRDPGLVIPIPLINVGKYFRLRYLNDGGVAAIAILAPPGETSSTAVAQTSFRLQTQLLPQATKELTRTLDQSISGSDPVGVVRAALMGRNPSNVIANIPASGLSMSNNSTSALNAGITYTGSWEDRLGYTGITILVKTDQISAANGLSVEHSDTAAGTTVRATDLFTFDAAALSNGYMFVTLSPKSLYFRVKYTNGGTNQSSFYLETNLLTGPTELQQQQIEAALNAESDGIITRSIMNAKDPESGTYANITRSETDAASLTGLHVAVQQHEVSTPILALTTWVTSQVTVLSTVTTILNTGTAGRKSVAIKCISTNTKPIFIGPTSGLTTGNGYELAAGESVVLEIDNTTGVYGIASTAASQVVSVIEIS